MESIQVNDAPAPLDPMDDESGLLRKDFPLEVDGSMVRINGFFRPLINGVFLGVISPTYYTNLWSSLPATSK